MKKILCILTLLLTTSNYCSAKDRVITRTSASMLDALNECVQVELDAQVVQAATHATLTTQLQDLQATNTTLKAQRTTLQTAKLTTSDITALATLDDQIIAINNLLTTNCAAIDAVKAQIKDNYFYSARALKACIYNHVDIDTDELIERLASLPQEYYQQLRLDAQLIQTCANGSNTAACSMIS